MVGEGEPIQHAEVVARPDAVDRLVEHCAAVGDVQARTVDAAAYEDVIDPTAEFEGHLAGSDQRVRRRFWQARLELVRPLVERAIQRKAIPASSATSARPCTTASWSSTNPSPSTTPTWQQPSPPVPLARASSAQELEGVRDRRTLGNQ
jgi:hypothetical protein